MPRTTPEKIQLVFEYEGKKYTIVDTGSVLFWDEYLDDWNWFWWEEGNGGCDCNRSIFIRKTYPDFPDLNCGHTIELSDYSILP